MVRRARRWGGESAGGFVGVDWREESERGRERAARGREEESEPTWRGASPALLSSPLLSSPLVVGCVAAANSFACLFFLRLAAARRQNTTGQADSEGS
nr:unnamed protein product [Digitaria exilis]